MEELLPVEVVLALGRGGARVRHLGRIIFDQGLVF